mmetsp:Transcript_47989/g.128417  ORF Transcript_47989/g.128417 Transcript_47989/m.128417 type:complete len:280 (-) Transcript_47989:394-1233(-)
MVVSPCRPSTGSPSTPTPTSQRLASPQTVQPWATTKPSRRPSRLRTTSSVSSSAATFQTACSSRTTLTGSSFPRSARPSRSPVWRRTATVWPLAPMRESGPSASHPAGRTASLRASWPSASPWPATRRLSPGSASRTAPSARSAPVPTWCPAATRPRRAPTRRGRLTRVPLAARPGPVAARAARGQARPVARRSTSRRRAPRRRRTPPSGSSCRRAGPRPTSSRASRGSAWLSAARATRARACTMASTRSSHTCSETPSRTCTTSMTPAGSSSPRWARR